MKNTLSSRQKQHVDNYDYYKSNILPQKVKSRSEYKKTIPTTKIVPLSCHSMLKGLHIGGECQKNDNIITIMTE